MLNDLVKLKRYLKFNEFLDKKKKFTDLIEKNDKVSSSNISLSLYTSIERVVKNIS